MIRRRISWAVVICLLFSVHASCFPQSFGAERVILSSAIGLPRADARHQSHPGLTSIPFPIGIRVVNACILNQKSRKNSAATALGGVDLFLKDNALMRDVRPGEWAAYRFSDFAPNDLLEIRLAGSLKVLDRVLVQFEKNCFYTLLLSGDLSGEQKGDLHLYIKKDYPLESSQRCEGKGTISLWNEVGEFPVRLTIAEFQRRLLSPRERLSIFLSPGSHPYILEFPYAGGKSRTISGRLEVVADAAYSVIIMPTPECSDRPMMLVFDDAKQAKTLLGSD